ncbi:hypothetical protein [Paraglaciecola arctica]|uniref:Uncharacterized protein n=1 Tax=Paraglaciecola arctica BSs20135 TaxID=493475 RepID=K6Y0J9_9ALTE|nr:hypothetical protein [Paraglaciecola arctica]GAC17431.1 hypothetical protein GARC_0449 [Paraglaciecola arctica BSs20135]|tara:strand:+ start:653 stop:832 length:180 start_codon:yes stop_codon:yes gene_type:complete
MANGVKPSVYQSPLSKLFARQQPKVKAKKGMANLLLTYAENDSKRIAHLLSVWMDEKRK